MSRRRRIPPQELTHRRDICPKRYCRVPLTIGTDGNGRQTARCEPCERNANGLCRDCPSKIPFLHKFGRGSRQRCDRCRLRREAEKKKAAYHRDPDHFRAIKRKSSRRPAVKARQRERCREWQRRHPLKGDPFARAYARAWQREFLRDPQVREQVNARRRELAAKKRAAAVARGDFKRLYPRPFGARRRVA